MLARVLGGTGVASGVGVWRGLASRARSEVLHNSMSDGCYDVSSSQAAGGELGERPLSADPGVRQARGRQPPSSLLEPPLLHDSLSEADYSYYQQRRPTGGPRMSSITEPDYFLHNSLSEGTYDMPLVLQRTASLNPRRGQGFATAKQRPTMQRIVVVNRAAAQEPPERLHDSFSHVEYVPRAR